MCEKKTDIFDRIMGLPLLCHFYGPYEKHKQILLYILFGGFTTVVSIGSFVLFVSVMGMNELVANVLSWLLAVGFAYITNRIWVFCSRTQGRELGKEVVTFYSGRLLTLAMEEGMLLVFVTWLCFNSTVIKVLAQVAVLIGNYVISKFFIFRKNEHETI